MFVLNCPVCGESSWRMSETKQKKTLDLINRNDGWQMDKSSSWLIKVIRRLPQFPSTHTRGRKKLLCTSIGGWLLYRSDKRSNEGMEDEEELRRGQKDVAKRWNRMLDLNICRNERVNTQPLYFQSHFTRPITWLQRDQINFRWCTLQENWIHSSATCINGIQISSRVLKNQQMDQTRKYDPYRQQRTTNAHLLTKSHPLAKSSKFNFKFAFKWVRSQGNRKPLTRW